MSINKTSIHYVTTECTNRPVENSSFGALLLVAYGSERNNIRVYIPCNENFDIYMYDLYMLIKILDGFKEFKYY